MQLTQQDFPAHIFRAYDIRGRLSDLRLNVLVAIARAFAIQLKTQQIEHIVLGYDARHDGKRYATYIQHILAQQNIHVTALGCCSTPYMYFMAQKLTKTGSGIMLTASHNPKTDHGIKWLSHRSPPTPQDIQNIAHLAKQQYLSDVTLPMVDLSKKVEIPSAQAYLTQLAHDIRLEKALIVVVDGMHGAAGQYAKAILTTLGCQVIALRCDANGDFPDHAPDPSKKQHLTLLCEAVKQHGADIGLALDGDGDRLVVVDETASIISPDQLMCVFAEMCLKQYPQQEIVFDVKCANMITQVAQHYGGTATMLRTGSTFLRRYLAEHPKAVFGGEYAGHYVFNDGRGLGYDDGLYAGLRLMEYLTQRSPMTLSALFVDYPERCFTEDTYIATTGVPAQTLLKHFKQSYGHNTQAKLTEIDGIRLDFAHGFGIIRASNTGEYLTVRFDAINSVVLDEIKATFSAVFLADYPCIAAHILQAH
ncbi:phosphomannomutase/phosphoglucomutase [Acinetobacter rathckeae]|uniref:phosphomannomutase/phosphoglucomutase n=1 Tax=Acinetobacter rathckeae TaxID=2605272 RepID=UPI0018A2EAA0|nr:phosphomannomutase/phosphoglucomutase [Acinetobacter rathckeae]MBF7688589.1 phosphomannomutase/phosphoglucomutase [Acinetobacter rathckeae]MBF7695836.1 phosphomannomutase/phosphoglucomutase [Acinetobacter rathckeae]